MKLASLPVASLADTAPAIAKSISDASDGILWLDGVPEAPFDKIAEVLQSLVQDRSVGKRLNDAYSKNLVFKDSFANGNGGPTIDRKRVLDLSPERLAIIQEAEPDLILSHPDLSAVLHFWEESKCSTHKILKALALAIGSDDVVQDAAFNYRMVDYNAYEKDGLDAPRCGEHRDFGSFTLIQAVEPGFQYQSQDGDWMAVEPRAGAALLLFGWCTQIRSNGRIPAAMHRVVDLVPRRVSAVLFCAPKNPETTLEPVVLDDEARQYIGGVMVGQLRGKMARKWRHREGTEDDKDRIYEEEEIRVTNMKTQDDVVRTFVAV